MDFTCRNVELQFIAELSSPTIRENSGLRERGLTMTDNNTCSRCGSSKLESGRVQSTGRLHFHIENPRFLTIHTGYVPILATMCLDCGKIDFIGEVDKARKISKQNQEK
jgi:predicted nucleic-acid-binding Zn-ribbon protein